MSFKDKERDKVTFLLMKLDVKVRNKDRFYIAVISKDTDMTPI